jgi:PAS domain S-box-containing protein
MALLAALYFLTGYAGMEMHALHGLAALVWVPSGLSLAALVSRGVRLWPGVAVGAALVGVSRGNGSSPIVVAAMAAGSALEAALGAWALRRFTSFHPALDRPRDVVALALVGGAGPTALGGAVGVGLVGLLGAMQPPALVATWWTWWWGHFTGALLVAPLLLAWSVRTNVRLRGPHAWRFEPALLAVAVAAVGALVFFEWLPSNSYVIRKPHLLFPLSVWAGFRFGPRGASATSLLVSAMAIAGTLLGLGPYAELERTESLVILHSFLTVSAFTMLMIAAIAVDRAAVAATARASAQALQRTYAELERRVHERTLDLEGANRDLAKREEQLRNAQALARMGSFEWDLHKDEITSSEELRRMVGAEAGVYPLTFERAMQRVLPADRDRVTRLAHKLITEGGPLSFEMRVMRPDGAVRLLEVEEKLETDPTGRPVRVVGTFHDVTEHRKDEEAWLALAAIVESSGDAIVGMTLDGVIESWNEGAVKIYGWAAAEVIGKRMCFLVGRERHDELVRTLARVRGGERVPTFETVARRKNGSSFEASITMSAIPDVTGGLVGVSAITRDITDVKSAAVRLEESLREKEILLREIHHRVKNNLQVIASLLALQASVAPEGVVRHELEESQTRIQSMALVHELLYESKDLASIDLGGYIRGLVDRLVRTFRPTEGISVSIEIPDGIHLDIDSDVACGLVVNELVSNALRHAFPRGRHGRVAISVERGEGRGLVLVVSDDGVGLPAGFDLGAVRTLGLQVVGSLAKQLRGALVVSREHGTSFRLSFTPR